jgi:hypothetical protein
MDISKLSVLLSLSAGGFAAGLKSAEGSLRAAGIAAGFGIVLSGGAIIGKLGELTSSTFENIAATSRMADSLGISTKSLSQLSFAASLTGANLDDLRVGLTKMVKNLQEAQTGSGAAADALTALKLNAKELQNLPTDVALGKIADALNGLGNKGQRAALSTELLGKGAVSLLPLLSEGSEGIRKLSAESDKLGVSFDAIDAAKVELANQTIIKMEAALQGVLTQLAIKLAPYIEAFTDKLVAWASQGDGIAKRAVGWFENILSAIAYAADFMKIFDAAWYGLNEVVVLVASEVVGNLDIIGKAIVDVINTIPGMKVAWNDTLGSMRDSLLDQSQDADKKMQKAWGSFNNGDNQKAVKSYFQSINTEADKAAKAIAASHEKFGGLAIDVNKNASEITKKLAELEAATHQGGESAADKAADDIKKLGGTDIQQQLARMYAEQTDHNEQAIKDAQKLSEAAKKVWDDAKTPLEKYNDELKKLDELHKRGLISDELFKKSKGKAFGELTKESANNEAPEIIEAGSSAAASFIAKINNQNNGNDAAQQQIAATKASNDLLAQIRDGVDAGQKLAVATF